MYQGFKEVTYNYSMCVRVSTTLGKEQNSQESFFGCVVKEYKRHNDENNADTPLLFSL